MGVDRYGSDVLAGDWRRPPRGRTTEHPLEMGLVVEHITGFCGAIVHYESGVLELEDRHGTRRAFRLGPGFLLEGRPTSITTPVHAPPAAPARTASGSVSAVQSRARVARAARIYVEGRHDAELVEQVWGDDLRAEGVVVEELGGIDDLAAIVADFAPGPGRRLGVLVDHLVPGSKEHRLADAVRHGPYASSTLVAGHPFVDVWAAIKPGRLGLAAWPEIPRDVEWKAGICAALGWPHADAADIATAWRRIRSAVRDWTDLEPALLGRVEELIDFVTSDD